MVFLPKLYITITFFLLEIINLRFHSIFEDTIIRVVGEYHDLFSLISDGTAKLKHYPNESTMTLT